MNKGVWTLITVFLLWQSLCSATQIDETVHGVHFNANIPSTFTPASTLDGPSVLMHYKNIFGEYLAVTSLPKSHGLPSSDMLAKRYHGHLDDLTQSLPERFRANTFIITRDPSTKKEPAHIVYSLVTGKNLNYAFVMAVDSADIVGTATELLNDFKVLSEPQPLRQKFVWMGAYLGQLLFLGYLVSLLGRVKVLADANASRRVPSFLKSEKGVRGFLSLMIALYGIGITLVFAAQMGWFGN